MNFMSQKIKVKLFREFKSSSKVWQKVTKSSCLTVKTRVVGRLIKLEAQLSKLIDDGSV